MTVRDFLHSHCNEWTEQDDKTMAEMYGAGASNKMVARVLGRTVPAVMARRMRMEVVRTRSGYTDRQLLDMLARKAAGQTSREIAAAHGVTRNAVIGLLHRIERDCAESGFALWEPSA